MNSVDSREEPLVFISHAGDDVLIAGDVAERLNISGIRTLLDAQILNAGDNFVDFMETSLTTAHYFLLLWSKAAAARPWVTAEWQAAFVRAVQENTAFFITARLEDFAVPKLLAPRLWVDLFPQLSPGLDKLISTVRGDIHAAHISAKPVAAPNAGILQMGDATVYITSALFDFTVPVGVDLEIPLGVCLDYFLAALQLPKYQPLDTQGRIAVRVSYSLLHEELKLDRVKTLTNMGVRRGDVLTLESNFEFVGQTQPVTVEPGGTKFRTNSTVEQHTLDSNITPEIESLLRRSNLLMHSAARRAGLIRTK